MDTLLVLLSEYRLTVWMCRNKIRFDKKKLSKTDITNSFYHKIKARVGLDFHRLDKDILGKCGCTQQYAIQSIKVYSEFK